MAGRVSRRISASLPTSTLRSRVCSPGIRIRAIERASPPRRNTITFQAAAGKVHSADQRIVGQTLRLALLGFPDSQTVDELEFVSRRGETADADADEIAVLDVGCDSFGDQVLVRQGAVARVESTCEPIHPARCRSRRHTAFRRCASGCRTEKGTDGRRSARPRQPRRSGPVPRWPRRRRRSWRRRRRAGPRKPRSSLPCSLPCCKTTLPWRRETAVGFRNRIALDTQRTLSARHHARLLAPAVSRPNAPAAANGSNPRAGSDRAGRRDGRGEAANPLKFMPHCRGSLQRGESLIFAKYEGRGTFRLRDPSGRRRPFHHVPAR